MPITKAAKKKLLQDAKRQKYNHNAKKSVLEAIKKFKKSKSEKQLAETFSLIDMAKKKNIFHKNKAARLKSALSKMINSKEKKSEEKVKVKKQAPKKLAKKTSKK